MNCAHLATTGLPTSSRCRESAGDKTISRTGEGWTFGIEDGGIDNFLSDRGLKVVSHHTASDLEKRYLTADDGTFFGRINGTQSIVVAAVAGDSS